MKMGIQAKEFNIGFNRAENLFSHGLSPLDAFWQSCGSHVPYTEVLQRWLFFRKVLPSPQRNSGALSEWQSGSWSPPWPRPFFHDYSVWPQQHTGTQILLFTWFRIPHNQMSTKRILFDYNHSRIYSPPSRHIDGSELTFFDSLQTGIHTSWGCIHCSCEF
jgi:hypothetical protein